MRLTGSRVLVTGGAGFIGSHVVDHLMRMDCAVRVLDDFSTGTRENLSQHGSDVEIIEGDIRDVDVVESSVQGCDVVVHMAVANLRVSLSDPMSVHEVNATGTLNVWQAATRAGVQRAAYVSSSEAYGSALTVPMAEHHELVPTTVYGASKAAGELYAMAHLRTYGLQTTVIRPFNNYGPREHADGMSAEVIPKFVHRMLCGEQPVIFGDGSQTRDFTWVQDSARGIIEATEADQLVGRAVNIAHGEEVSVSRVAQLIAERLELPLTPDHQPERPGDVMRHFADVSLAREVLGFEATVDIATGIDRYVTWLQAQNPDLEGWLAAEEVRNW